MKQEDGKRKHSEIMGYVVFVDIFLLGMCIVALLQKRLPQCIYLYKGEEERFSYAVPVEASIQAGTTSVVCRQKNSEERLENFRFGEPFSLYAKEKGSCDISLKILGIVPIKKVKINVIEKKSYYVGGKIIGIKIDTEGALVLGTGPIEGQDGQEYEPAKNIVHAGDYIVAVNDIGIQGKEELVHQMEKVVEGRVKITIKREQYQLEVALPVVIDQNHQQRLGIWVRDDTQGIGTLTCYNDNGDFFALGHGINDVDTGVTMKVREGYICNAGIYNIVPGKKGEPGEIAGYLKKSSADIIGTIKRNSKYGIKGSLVNPTLCDQQIRQRVTYPIGLRQDIREGGAQIVSEISGEKKAYGISITNINANDSEKGLEIQVEDPDLLHLTNGIIQGLSGSPILQNGKIIGAVTHVLVNNPRKGYGIFIENMIEK